MCWHSLNTLTHDGRVVQNAHAICFRKRLPAQLDVGNIAQTAQESLADHRMTMPRVVAVPVQVEGEQGGNVATLHCSPSICFWMEDEKIQ